MTLDEIQQIVKIAGAFDLDFPSQMDEFCDKVYDPVFEAVAANDKTTIDYILSCSKGERHELYTAIMDGAIEGMHPAAIELYIKICDEQGYKPDVRVLA